MPRLLSKDVEARAKKSKLKLWYYAPYESNFVLTNKFIKVGFQRLHEVMSFLDYYEGQPQKRLDWKYEGTFKNSSDKTGPRVWIDHILKKKHDRKVNDNFDKHIACANWPNCDITGCGYH